MNETIPYQNTAQTIQNTVIQVHILTKHPHIIKPTHIHTHTLKQVKTTTVQDTHKMKLGTIQPSTLSIRSP
jgi:predicted AAA+ superfamily ATPase